MALVVHGSPDRCWSVWPTESGRQLACDDRACSFVCFDLPRNCAGPTSLCSVPPFFTSGSTLANAISNMSDSWMLRSDYAKLAKTFNAVGAPVSTVFLFTRIWARTTQYRGLWWDDYFRKSTTSHTRLLEPRILTPTSTASHHSLGAPAHRQWPLGCGASIRLQRAQRRGGDPRMGAHVRIAVLLVHRDGAGEDSLQRDSAPAIGGQDPHRLVAGPSCRLGLLARRRRHVVARPVRAAGSASASRPCVCRRRQYLVSSNRPLRHHCGC